MPDVYKLNGRTVTREEFLGESKASEARLRAMFESGQGPAVMTDDVFLQGNCNGNQFERRPEIGDALAAVARADGVDPKGKVYVGGLARYPGDGRAWVSGRGDVARVLDDNGWGAAGAVNRPVAAKAEPLGVKVAPEIVEEAIEDRLAAEDRESVSGQEAADLVESTTAALARPSNPGVVEHRKHKGRGY